MKRASVWTVFLLVWMVLFGLAGGAPAAEQGTAGAVVASASPVDLNTAGISELATLPGIGEATAKAIIDYRDQHGVFQSPDDLLQVKGIGEKKLAAVRDLVIVK